MRSKKVIAGVIVAAAIAVMIPTGMIYSQKHYKTMESDCGNQSACVYREMKLQPRRPLHLSEN